eukprot:9948330-Lingulodinium_polyedra.AAC.1
MAVAQNAKTRAPNKRRQWRRLSGRAANAGRLQANATSGLQRLAPATQERAVDSIGAQPPA